MDIVERLRRINAFLHVTEDEPEYDYKLSYEAADEIERLREENQKQREKIMFLNSMIQTEHEIIRVAALKEGE